MYKVGIGLDSHRIKKKTKKKKINKNLILGGVEVSKEYFPLADSDGDVIIHSLCNALSTAIGQGSLDTWAGKMYKKGITDSKEYLKVVFKKVKNKGFKINNVSIMVEGKKPKLEALRVKITQSLAKLLKIKKDCLGLAFTTGQDLTSFGKGKGIQATSIVLLFK